MFVQGLVSECDFSGVKYNGDVQGAWVVAQGATGRWCTVLHVGPEYIRNNALQNQVLTVEQAYRQIDLKGGYPDFGIDF